MASNKPKLTLMDVPLEVRHQIYKHVATRETQPEKLLRYWFEKKEVQEKTAELAAKNITGAPQVVYAGDDLDEEYDDYGSDDDENPGEDSSGEGDSDDDLDENSDEDEEDDEDEESSEEEEADEEDADMAGFNDTGNFVLAFTNSGSDTAQVSTATTLPTIQLTKQPTSATAAQAIPSTSAGHILTDANQGLPAALASANTAMQTAMATVAALAVPTAAAPLSAPAPLQTPLQTSVQAGDGDGSEDSDEENSDEEMGEDDEGEEDAEMGEVEDEGYGDGATQQNPPAPVITAHRKWRHIPQFLRITHCPPPLELLLTSQQLNAEANSWFYDVAVLRIDATSSFAHTSFFEEAFGQITEAAFSPMKNIRKVEVTFVWDTTWLRSEQAGCAAVIFPALLRQRAFFVTSILARALSLSEVVIHWHDSAQDGEAVDLMNDVLIGFLDLSVTVNVEPHYIATDAKPYRKSVAGKQRIEFQRIVDNGLDRLG